jgi:hypothetical protein
LGLRFWILDWGTTRMKIISSARVFDSYSDNRKSKTQNRKWWLGLSVFVFVLVVAGAVATAQQPKKVHRIGYLSAIESGGEAEAAGAIRVALRELDPATPSGVREIKEILPATARTLGLMIQPREVRDAKGFESAFEQ